MKKIVTIAFIMAFMATPTLGCGGDTAVPQAEPSTPDPNAYALGQGASTTLSTSEEPTDTSSSPLVGESLCGIGYCIADWVGDTHCDWACNCIETEYDGGDCGIFIDEGAVVDEGNSTGSDTSTPEDVPSLEDESTPPLDTATDTGGQSTDQGTPSDSSNGFFYPCNEFIPCHPDWLGDDFCDGDGCNCEAAGFDGGDCPPPSE